VFSELRCARERPLRVSVFPRLNNLSVNAKQLAQPDFQSDPSRCKSGHGCCWFCWLMDEELMVDSQEPNPSTINSPTINKPQRSQSVNSSARRPAKAEARGASPRESATFIYDLPVGAPPLE